METVRGRSGVIHFDGQRCIHSRNCVLDRPDVFVPNVKGEWIHPERAGPGELLALALNCPSGAIRYEPVDGPGETAPLVNTVRLREHGPLAFHAPLSVAGTDAGYRATLCRCGASKRKPFCDGSHAAASFAASGEASVTQSQSLPRRDGPLVVEPAPDGPLHVRGSLEVVTGTGKTINRTGECWLCRCGQSRNKPYCDGSHKAAGFRSGGA
jgi:CDGSH-type Zn-finger protein/uncharacterized Fe-S cluster protein YjdI